MQMTYLIVDKVFSGKDIYQLDNLISGTGHCDLLFQSEIYGIFTESLTHISAQITGMHDDNTLIWVCIYVKIIKTKQNKTKQTKNKNPLC